jgi:hypothetical protein
MYFSGGSEKSDSTQVGEPHLPENKSIFRESAIFDGFGAEMKKIYSENIEKLVCGKYLLHMLTFERRRYLMTKQADKNKLVSVRFSQADIAKLQREAERLRLSIASLVRMKVVQVLETDSKVVQAG